MEEDKTSQPTHDDHQDDPPNRPEPSASAMRTLKLNETLAMCPEEADFGHDKVELRIRRTPSGWTYEYYGVETGAVRASCYVPYFDELRRTDNRRGERTSFMYELRVNEVTVLNSRLSGFPEGAPGKTLLRRVPGGWIYEFLDAEAIVSSACFVPMKQQSQVQQRLPERQETRERYESREQRHDRGDWRRNDYGNSGRGIWGGNLRGD